MITTNSKDQKAIFPAAKQEAPSPAPARQWSSAGFRNPRIVRVSRTFGGKDRHSKVCTVRGLRDRRIRLSVPTAVQLYELQDRLGLGQPSKVIDWLIDNAKADIDKLPPLQFPHGALMGQFHHDPAPATAKPSEPENFFSPKLFGVSSYTNYFHSTDHSPSLSLSHQLGLGQFALPHIDFSNDVASAASSSTSNSQLFFRAQPSATASLFGNFPQFVTENNRHQINHEQSSSLFASLTQHSHVSLPNYTLMPSLHQNPSADPNSIKPFPAICNPRLFTQSGFENRSSGKDHD